MRCRQRRGRCHSLYEEVLCSTTPWHIPSLLPGTWHHQIPATVHQNTVQIKEHRPSHPFLLLLSLPPLKFQSLLPLPSLTLSLPSPSSSHSSSPFIHPSFSLMFSPKSFLEMGGVTMACCQCSSSLVILRCSSYQHYLLPLRLNNQLPGESELQAFLCFSSANCFLQINATAFLQVICHFFN